MVLSMLEAIDLGMLYGLMISYGQRSNGRSNVRVLDRERVNIFGPIINYDQNCVLL